MSRPVRELTHADQLRIDDAVQRLISKCMERQGFTYHERRPLTLEESRPTGYVQDDVAWARKHGYGSRIAEKSSRARATDPNIAYRKGLSAERRRAFDTALDGGPTARVIVADVPGGGTIRKRADGCIGEAERKLYGDLETWFVAEKAADSIRPLYVGELLADKKFARAVRAWSRCMQSAGHPYRDPGEARQAAGQADFGTELRIAVAAATCARQTSLKTVGRQREAHYVDQLRTEFGGALDTAQRLRHRALTRAEQIVEPRE
ncbi:hypothetical protein [Streptomyces sp. WZ.A104]|uniref:hypothetical protein n=1 Tax=Streptomyces sp. WZ.A104 TaxID=2023771 RepID=UPI00211C986A|nr:hypothetical protein [Streptomyces sp. WZ.A104]